MITLRKYQEEAIAATFKYFYSGKRGNPLIVAPTGSGKSHMIGGFCKLVADRWPTQKITVISHVKEILSQDYKTIKKHMGNKAVGLYSAGLKSKTIKNITVAGIQSVYDKPELFDQTDIFIIDEAHTIPPTKGGRYHKFFSQVKKPVIGYTATPFRLGKGYLHIGENSFFDDIIYTIPIKTLQDEGYLCRLTSKGTKKRLDASDIKKQAGDYLIKELSLAFDKVTITNDIVAELLIYKILRKKWLLFAIDIEHAEHIAYQLNESGIRTACVHSKMPKGRDAIISDFKAGEYQVLVSVAVLTTGFDVPDVDLIALMRPTASPVLHIQIIGRGLRPVYAPGSILTTKESRLIAISAGTKKDCLILDFAGNLLRNGPIDAPVIKVKGKGGGEAIMKECVNCYEIVHAAVRICPCCNTAFKFRHKLTAAPSENKVIAMIDWHMVDEVEYFNYVGARDIPMLKVSYICGLRRFSEYICFEHSGFAKYKAQHWWKRRSQELPPETAQEAVDNSDTLSVPTRILVEEGKKFSSIQEHHFKGEE